MKLRLIFLLLLCTAYFTINAQFNWEHLSGPPGSSYSRIFSNDKYAFIPEGDFLYRSADGITWEKINHKVSDFICVYYDTLFSIGKVENSPFLQYSTDQGEHWIIEHLPDEISDFGDLAKCAHGLYIAQDKDSILYRSTDLGITWVSIVPPGPFTNLAYFDETIYISSDTMLWRFEESTASWTDITPPLPKYIPELRELEDFVAIDSHIIVYAADFLFVSNDHGILYDTLEAYSTNPFDQLTLVGDAVCFSAFGSILRSQDFGMHWDTLVDDFYPQPAFFTGLRNILLGTTYDRGVFRWEDTTGLSLNSHHGLGHGLIYNLAYGSGKIWTAGGSGVFAYDLPTASWSPKMQLPEENFDYQIITANDHGWVVVAEATADHFYFSENQGSTWDTIHPSFDFDELQLVGDQLFAFYTKLYRSADKGQHWELIDINIRGDEIISYRDKKYLLGHGRMYYSLDNGLTWDSYNLLVPDAYSLYASEDKMYLISSDFLGESALFISEDGIEWTSADVGLPEIQPFTLWYYHHPLFFRDATSYYAFLCNDGHYSTHDFSTPWSPLESTLTGKDYLIIDDIIFLGGEGLYASVIQDPYLTAINEISISTDESFKISPNPAAEIITLSMNPSFKPKNEICIYSPEGVLVKSVNVDCASHNINIDISGLPDGLYYVLIAGAQAAGIHSFVKLN